MADPGESQSLFKVESVVMDGPSAHISDAVNLRFHTTDCLLENNPPGSYLIKL